MFFFFLTLLVLFLVFLFFFFNDTATTEIYTLSLHDALPISSAGRPRVWGCPWSRSATTRSEEHTSELQSHLNLVCRLLLEKKKKNNNHLNKIKKKKKKERKKKQQR